MVAAHGSRPGGSGFGSGLPFHTPERSGLPSELRGAGPDSPAYRFRRVRNVSSPTVPKLIGHSNRMSTVKVWPACKRLSFFAYGANVNPVAGTYSSYVPAGNSENVKIPVRVLSVL